jgi:putative endonuclease
LYTGIALDVKKRLQSHQDVTGGRGAKYLRGRGPLKVILRKKVGSRSLALKVEKHIKKLPRSQKEALIINRDCLKEIIRTCDQ